jgi:hypothetical protein
MNEKHFSMIDKIMAIGFVATIVAMLLGLI